MEREPKHSPNQASVSSDEIQNKIGLSMEGLSMEKSHQEKQADFKYDCEVVRSYKDGSVGINFEDTLLVDGKFDWSIDDSRLKQIVEEKEVSSNDIAEARKEEDKKEEAFREYLKDFNGQLKQTRLNPFGPLSPLSVYQSKVENGITVSDRFIRQAKDLSEYCDDITVVVPFYDRNKPEEERANVPRIEEAGVYVEICSQFISGLDSTNGLTLEIGNETNVSHSTGEMFNGSAREQHTNEVNPSAYADFYITVAQELKAKHPEVKLAIAGVACYDKTYLEVVLRRINEITSGQVSALVDVISYHPYGQFIGETEVSEGFFSAHQIENGQFTGDNLDFGSQNEQMLTLARQYGVELKIEEINFSSDDQKRKEHLKKFLALSARQGVVTKLWPSAVMPNNAK